MPTTDILANREEDCDNVNQIRSDQLFTDSTADQNWQQKLARIQDGFRRRQDDPFALVLYKLAQSQQTAELS